MTQVLVPEAGPNRAELTRLKKHLPRDPSIQIMPTLGRKSVNITYIGLFGSLGYFTEFLKSGRQTRSLALKVPESAKRKGHLLPNPWEILAASGKKS